MNKFVIITDSASDISPATLASWGIKCADLRFRFEGAEKDYSNSEMPIKEFYDKMRKGGIAKTSAVNPDGFMAAFEEILKEGSDVLYLGFSSGLSTTFNSARIAANMLKDKYSERKIIVVDTLAASAGQGLLVYLANEEAKKGASIEEVAEFVENNKLNLCHWFTVDDLVYLKRGGRISPTLAFVGNILGIKPVLHVDNEGHLVNVTKARGRKNALNTLFEKYEATALDPAGGVVFISQADCYDEAKSLADRIKEKCGAEVQIITDIGPVIGAHAGPGTIALFFIGKER